MIDGGVVGQLGVELITMFFARAQRKSTDTAWTKKNGLPFLKTTYSMSTLR
jgi:hypothetical protein